MWRAYNSMKESPGAGQPAAFREARDQRGQRYRRVLRDPSARWMRILWRCWTDHERYRSEKYAGAAALTPTA